MLFRCTNCNSTCQEIHFFDHLDALLDLMFGSITFKDLPPNFATLGIEMSLERFRRILRIHPEFCERLSDSDRSMLWRSNYRMAAALYILKMESAKDARERLMNNIGLLREDANTCWDLEFKGYRGLRSVNDLPRRSVTHLFRKDLTKHELEQAMGIMKFIVPLMKDSISFQLITMIMLLDTSNLIENVVTNFDAVYTSIQPSEVRILSLMDVMYDSDEAVSPGNKYNDTNIASSFSQKKSKALEKISRCQEKRFHEIKMLQRHYIQLLRNHCIHSSNPKLRRLGDADLGLKRTMRFLKQLAQYELIKLCERSVIYECMKMYP